MGAKGNITIHMLATPKEELRIIPALGSSLIMHNTMGGMEAYKPNLTL